MISIIADVKVCPVCQGRGVVPHNFYTGYNSTSNSLVSCNSCNGKGVIIIPDYIQTDINTKVSDLKSCATCKYNDGNIYTSSPAKYLCTLSNTYYKSCHSCNEYESK